MKNTVTIILSIAIGFLLGTFIVPNNGQLVGSGSDSLRLTSFSQSTTTVAVSGKNTIVEANGARGYLLLQNMDGTNFVHLHFGDATSTVTDYKLLAGETFTIGRDNLYNGKITGLADTAIVDVAIVEAY